MNDLDDYDRPKAKTSLVNGDDRDASRGRKMGTAGQQEVRFYRHPNWRGNSNAPISVLAEVQHAVGDVSAGGGAGPRGECGLRGEEAIQDEDGRR